MIRTLLYLIGGVLLGGIIHIVTILALPLLAEETTWTRIADYDADNRVLVLPPVAAGEPNPLQLDPELIYGLCRVDLTDGPAYLSGVLPDAFWSVAVYNSAGVVTYSTTNRDGIGQTVGMGIFNADQTRLLAQQQIDIAEGLLVIEARSDDLFVLVRLSPPHQVMRPRFEEALSRITCGPRPEA
jgi:uncharacterized membrane protein